MKIWIVEIYFESYGKTPSKWMPTIDCALTKKQGIEKLRQWRKDSGYRCRLRKYIASPNAKLTP